MSFEKSFCPSPWFHMRINNSGTYEYCRWQTNEPGQRINFAHNIQTQTPLEYFHKTLSPLRQSLLNGHSPTQCNDCYIMEQHGKVSGRQRQLLKVGVIPDHFNKSLASSPMRPLFDYSADNHGDTLANVRDWQIDLGNYCNSACVFCVPESSSRLASEFKQLGLIDSVPASSWCDNPILLARFCDVLTASKDLQYLHFIGGETLITPGFRKILQALVDADLAKNITVGFTTNLTVWSESVNELLKQFYQVNLGMSIEALTKINDYVRYPSQLDRTVELLHQWVSLARKCDWLIQLRITPSCLTIHDLTTVYDYAWAENIAVESCNFLDEPKFLRISVLPVAQRQHAVDRLTNWIEQHPVVHNTKIVNTRDPHIAHQQIRQDAESYLHYLINAGDESNRLPDLIAYLKKLESNRKNSILHYLPAYEELFRTNGY